jgi:DNA (cytosine-5)-methyltransferase 1
MNDDRPTFGSLFAGIGGIDLGLERAGWRGRWQVEYEPFCQRVLAKHWPDVQRYGDIHHVDWSGVERVDLVAGGFPCQPVSRAGHRKAQDDARWLWPEFHRAIRTLRPRYVLVENVTNLLGVNGGSAFGDVLGDLAASGYDAEWDCIPAASFGALHERDRVWIVARSVADANSPRQSRFQGRSAHGFLDWIAGTGRDGGDCGGNPRWGTEPDVGRVAYGLPARVDRLRSLGNAVVPQVVEFIGQRLLEADALEEPTP